jgi:transposase InsO family protein
LAEYDYALIERGARLRHALIQPLEVIRRGGRGVRAVNDADKPGMIVADHGTELTSNAILACCAERRVDWHYIAPGKLMQNGFYERFNGRMRD